MIFCDVSQCGDVWFPISPASFDLMWKYQRIPVMSGHRWGWSLWSRHLLHPLHDLMWKHPLHASHRRCTAIRGLAECLKGSSYLRSSDQKDHCSGRITSNLRNVEVFHFKIIARLLNTPVLHLNNWWPPFSSSFVKHFCLWFDELMSNSIYRSVWSFVSLNSSAFVFVETRQPAFHFSDWWFILLDASRIILLNHFVRRKTVHFLKSNC